MTPRILTLGFALAVATAALAHQGVKNPAVKARMHSMSMIAANMKSLGQMWKGTVAFDPVKARSAAAAIADHAAATPDLFQSNESDPKSEALPEIWNRFDDFVAKALELETRAAGFSTSLSKQSDLDAAMKALGASCKSCHAVYRE